LGLVAGVRVQTTILHFVSMACCSEKGLVKFRLIKYKLWISGFSSVRAAPPPLSGIGIANLLASYVRGPARSPGGNGEKNWLISSSSIGLNGSIECRTAAVTGCGGQVAPCCVNLDGVTRPESGHGDGAIFDQFMGEGGAERKCHCFTCSSSELSARGAFCVGYFED
jgi:hypothetical protein